MTRARDLANIADGTFTATDLDLSGTLTVSGDANFDSGTLFVDVSANNVGIGTTTVNEKLVLGSADSGSNFLQITNSTTTAADNRGFYVGIDANENARIIQRENADMFFSTNNTEVMTLDASGNVGIGTSSPSTLLELSANNNSAASNNTLRFTDTDTATEANQQIGKIEFKSNDSSGDGALVRSYILSASEDTTPSSYISFGTNPGGAGNTTDERMRVTGTGNVGIGTAAPVGAGTALNVRGPSAGGTVGSVVAESYDGVGHITLYSGIGGTDLPSIVYPSIGLRFGAGSKTTSSYAEKMRIDSSGNLLVGGTVDHGGRLSLTAGANQHGTVIASNGSITGGAESGGMAEGVVDVDTTSLGTVLSIPITSQPSRWRRFVIQFMFSSGEYNLNSNSKSGTATVSFASLTSLTTLSLLDSTGNVASVSASGTTLQINFTSGFTSGTSNWEGVHVYYKILSATPSYIQMWNATLN